MTHHRFVRSSKRASAASVGRLLMASALLNLAPCVVFAQPSAPNAAPGTGTAAPENPTAAPPPATAPRGPAGAATATPPGTGTAPTAPENPTTAPPLPAAAPSVPSTGAAPHPPMPPGHGGGHALGAQTPKDASVPDAAIPAGSIEAAILDERGQPIPGAEVELLMDYESVAEGAQHKKLKGKAGPDGKVRFDSLPRELRYSYTVRALRDGGSYGIGPFRLKEDRGQNVRLHLFPTTHDPMQAGVGMRGFVYIQPREDVFHVEVLFRVMNLGTHSWLPRDVVMSLPQAFQAFDSPRDGAIRFTEQAGEGARLTGTFAPGQHDARFTFQVPSKKASSQSFQLTLPPHVAELRVITEAAPGMTLDVAGFERAETARGPGGDRVLITRRLMRPGQPVAPVHIQLGGLPTAGNARWIVVSLASLIALGGLASALLRRRETKDKSAAALATPDLERARTLLLDELVAVENAFQSGQVGPRTHEQTRRQLLDALARLDPATT